MSDAGTRRVFPFEKSAGINFFRPFVRCGRRLFRLELGAFFRLDARADFFALLLFDELAAHVRPFLVLDDGLDFVLEFFARFLEFAARFSETAREFRQFFSAEDEQNQNEDDDDGGRRQRRENCDVGEWHV